MTRLSDPVGNDVRDERYLRDPGRDRRQEEAEARAEMTGLGASDDHGIAPFYDDDEREAYWARVAELRAEIDTYKRRAG